MTSMSAQLMRCVDPRGYHESFIREGFFDDRRPLDTFRTMFFQLGVNHEPGVVGSSLVRAGGATVRANVDAHLTVASTDDFLIAKVTASENVAEEVVEEAQNVLSDLMSYSSFCPRSSLATDDPRIEWRLEIMNEDGCVLDAVVGSVMAALIDTRLPKVGLTIPQDDDVPVHMEQIKLSPEEKHSLILDDTLPVACSFFICTTADGKLTCDAPWDVLANLEGVQLNVVVGSRERLLRLSLRGEVSGEDELLSRALALAFKRREALIEAIRNSGHAITVLL